MGNWIISSPHRRVFAAFFLYAVVLGGIYTRLWDLQTAMGIKQGALGVALMGAALGTQISLMFATQIINFLGHRVGFLVLIPFIGVAQSLGSLSPTPLVLFIALFFSGLAIGTLEVIINLEADRVEHQMGKRIMNRSHAFWSFGFFFAGLLGALAKQAGLSPFLHLSGVSILVCALVLFLFHGFEAAPERRLEKTDIPIFIRPSMAIMVLVAFTLSAMLLEGAAMDWSIIYMRDIFIVTPLIATLAFTLGALSQGIVRYFADGFVDTYGPINVAKVMVALMGVGALLVSFSPDYRIAIFGFILIGGGTSAVFPLAMSAAAQRTDRPAAINVASLAQISFVTFLLAPPALGFIGEHVGMRAAFGISLPLVALSWFTLHSLKNNNQSRSQNDN